MHANIGPLPQRPATAGPPTSRLISIRYLILRAVTAAGAFAMGFVQTFTFARVLSPERFSLFIVVGGIGYSLWVADLGLAKILFVNLRGPHLAGRRDEAAARQATAVMLLYGLLALAAAAICFIGALTWSSNPRDAAELALFLLYITLNLAWFSLRSISMAVDLFVFYERLEFVRRTVIIAAMLSMLGGLPFIAFLIGANLLWGILFAIAVSALIRRDALAARLDGLFAELLTFFRVNRASIARSSTGALSSVFIATFPYYVVPIWFGLGAAPIIVEVTFRIFRGGCVIFAAICDLAIPSQTRALAAHDIHRMVHTTLLVAGLCCVPAAIGCAILIHASGPLFAFLLRSAATVPPAITPILIVLLITSIVQIVAEALLQYTGFFRSLAVNGAAVVAAMVVATAIAVVAKFDLVGFLAAYSAVYGIGALALAVAVIYGPVRAAVRPGERRAYGGLLRPAPRQVP